MACLLLLTPNRKRVSETSGGIVRLQASAYIHRLIPLPFGFELSQARALDWLQQASQSLGTEVNGVQSARTAQFYSRMLASGHILQRRTCLEDYTHIEWDRMQLYRKREKSGHHNPTVFRPPLEERMQIYAQTTRRLVSEAFEFDVEAPAYLVKVSCTGYESPNGLQRLVVQKQWERLSKLIELGHMGCYASVPATTLAANLLAGGLTLRSEGTVPQVSILFMELCTLHLRPLDEDVEQMVMNSLFADGAIRVDMRKEPCDEGLAFVDSFERVLPDSDKEMTWRLADSAFQMTLSRRVPTILGENLLSVVNQFLATHKLNLSNIDRFAIHPGGPKIIDEIARYLNVEANSGKISHSKAVLRNRGNMSSSTIPYIWLEMLHDAEVSRGELILSLAFGPGLTLTGNLLRKGTM